MISYPQCPRCNSKWDFDLLSTGQCRHCNLIRHDNDNDNDKYDFYLHNFLERDTIYWDLHDGNVSFYFDAKGDGITMPLLPFNITPAQLKIYLTFL